ncbi:MAG: alpha/beta hydrolase [Clostridia bacterium]
MLWMIVILSILLILILASIIISCVFYHFILNPKSAKKLNKMDKDKSKEKEAKKEDVIAFQQLLQGNAKEIYLEGYKKDKIHAYWLENEEQKEKGKSDTWIIAIHGYNNQATTFGDFAMKFYRQGYSLLVPDLRGCGKNECSYIGMGWHDRKDILLWIEEIKKRRPNASIILYGVSMGAATVMMTSGEEVPVSVKAYITDCGYTSVWEEFSYKMKSLFHLPPFPFLYLTSAITKLKDGYSFQEASSLKQLEKCDRPILLIHGSEDDFVPFIMQEKLYQAVKSEKEKLVIQGAKHAKSHEVEPERYWGEVFNFIELHK